MQHAGDLSHASGQFASGVRHDAKRFEPCGGPYGMCDYAPKEIICLEGDPGENLFQVVEGVCKLYRTTIDGRRQIVRFVYPGQWIGDVFARDYRYTAEAVNAASIKVFTKRELTSRIKTDPDAAAFMLNIATQSLEVAENQMVLLGRKAAGEKVASFLVHISEIQCGGDDNEDESRTILLPMHRNDIADYLGLTIETVCRKITSLRKAGYIELAQATEIRIVDVEGLRGLAEGERRLLH